MSRDNYSDFLSQMAGDENPSDRAIGELKKELLTLKLLRSAVQSQHPDDSVMQDFAKYVLPHLLQKAVGVTAKGGKFFDQLDQQKGRENVRRDNAGDQSLNTHLLNGLFPANIIEQRLEKLDTTVQRVVKERERRLVVAAFILHDFEKFPDVASDSRKLEIEEHRQIIDEKIRQLGLDLFINPDKPSAYREYIDDLLCMAYNAQRRWDTNWNFSGYGLQPTLKDRILRNLSDLTCLADSFASIIKHPHDAQSYKFKELLHTLSDGQLSLTYHSIAENRGVLTNVVNNAVMDAHTAMNTGGQQFYEPLLYLPIGIVYLTYGQPPAINIDSLPERVIKKVKQLCFHQLALRQPGFGRDGKGMKYADYYTLFCNDEQLMQIALKATLRILSDTKKSVTPKRSVKLKEFQDKGALSADYNFELGDDIRIDQLAEFGDVVCRKVWGGTCDRIETLRKARTKAKKKDKSLAELPKVDLDPNQLTIQIAEHLGLKEYLPQIREIQKINATLKELKVKGSTGGIPYEWYFIATKLIQGSGIESIREIAEKIIAFITQQTQPIAAQYDLPDGWEDLRTWVNRVVMIPEQTDGQLASHSVEAQVDTFLQELAGYKAAKKSGRGKLAICSVSHSAYRVKEQMESEVLFTPQVYTNKQMLGGSNAKRNISSIAALEMMLRQILMNQTQAAGKRFEDGKYRYLYFYPTYYFTPETSRFLQAAYSNIAQTRFTTGIRNHFISKDSTANFERSQYQSVDAFLIDERLAEKTSLPADHDDFKRDRTFKLSYPEDQPLTFFFMALPPGRDPTETESWIMPTWLAFATPMILDVKTVVSESPIPPFIDGAEFEETIFLDSAPQAIRTLVGQDRFRLDYILEGWESADGALHSSPLNALTSAYTIHLDVNAKQGKGGYDANWGKLTELAKDLDTNPLYVFDYLSRWLRKQKKDNIPIRKVQLYAYNFYPCFDPYVAYDAATNQLVIQDHKSPMNHPQKLTELYRTFYRANKRYNPKANAVLKPIDLAADVILKAESSFFTGETLVAAVAAEIFKLMDRVRGKRADGYAPISDREAERQAILAFSDYFVLEVFEKAFAGDRARLAGRQLNLIRNTCEFLYRIEQDKENQAENAQSDSDSND